MKSDVCPSWACFQLLTRAPAKPRILLSRQPDMDRRCTLLLGPSGHKRPTAELGTPTLDQHCAIALGCRLAATPSLELHRPCASAWWWWWTGGSSQHPPTQGYQATQPRERPWLTQKKQFCFRMHSNVACLYVWVSSPPFGHLARVPKKIKYNIYKKKLERKTRKTNPGRWDHSRET
jgi:hypothetical protein